MKITIVIPMEDEIVHDEHPYCNDETCPCHEDERQAILDELMHEWQVRSEGWYFKYDEEHG